LTKVSLKNYLEKLSSICCHETIEIENRFLILSQPYKIKFCPEINIFLIQVRVRVMSNEIKTFVVS